MIQKNDVILLAMQLGYFRTKSDEKRKEIVADMMETELLGTEQPKLVTTILETETERRSAAYKARQVKALAKVDADAAKPVSSGYHPTEYPVLSGKRFVVTVVQNNTDVHSDMLGALQTFCEHNGAQLIVCKTYYNKSGFNHPEHGADDAGIYFDPSIAKYVQESPVYLGSDKILLVANANVIPTAKNPLTGFADAAKAGTDVIIPAVKIALQCTGALKGARGRNLFSTGAVTLRNYVQRKAGQIASQAHNIGALYVEINSDGNPNCRHLEMMQGCDYFYDGGKSYSGYGVEKCSQVSCIQLGDIHAEKANKHFIHDAIEMIREYQPAHVALHDVCDFESRNHHNKKDPVFIYKQDSKGASVIQDLNCVNAVVFDFAGFLPDTIFDIIESNHDLALARWVRECDYKEDSRNAVLWFNLMAAEYANAHNPDFNLLEYALCEAGKHEITDTSGNELMVLDTKNVVFHRTDESVCFAGVEHGCHGDKGMNGSKASLAQYARLGVPINIGHSHTPGIQGQAYQAGVTGALDMSYNAGPSSWRVAHIVTYINGQRQIIFRNLTD